MFTFAHSASTSVQYRGVFSRPLGLGLLRGCTAEGLKFASPATLAGVEEPIIVVGTENSALLFRFDQEGVYIVCTQPCDLQRERGILSLGLTAAWHAYGFTPNTIAIRYDATAEQVTLYVNSQEVRTIPYRVDVGAQIVLAADKGGEALYTHFTLYSASAGGS